MNYWVGIFCKLETRIISKQSDAEFGNLVSNYSYISMISTKRRDRNMARILTQGYTSYKTERKLSTKYQSYWSKLSQGQGWSIGLSVGLTRELMPWKYAFRAPIENLLRKKWLYLFLKIETVLGIYT